MSRQGFRFESSVCDVFMLFSAVSLCQRHRWDVVHAVEESVFIAWLLNKLLGLCRTSMTWTRHYRNKCSTGLASLRPFEPLAQTLRKTCYPRQLRRDHRLPGICSSLSRKFHRQRVSYAWKMSAWYRGSQSLRNGQSSQKLLPELDGPDRDVCGESSAVSRHRPVAGIVFPVGQSVSRRRIW